jgi:hypothetical protein
MIKLYDDYTINVMTSQGPGRLYGIDKNKVLVEHDYKYLVEYAPELVGIPKENHAHLGRNMCFGCLEVLLMTEREKEIKIGSLKYHLKRKVKNYAVKKRK